MWASRRTKLRSTPLPPEWSRIAERNCVFYLRLPGEDRRELDGHLTVFLDEKRFEGCAGLEIGDEIRVTIAASACLLLLHRRTDYFPRLRTILVYPASYAAQTTRHLGSGVMNESVQVRAGESWPHGAVVLAWDEVLKGAAGLHASNVVWHEFAHQLDSENGGHADGVPVLGEGEPFLSRPQRCARWKQVMRAEYESLRSQVQSGANTLLRAYGATQPAEFFAVATEAFFGQAEELQRLHPALYGELSWYYRQDPARWAPGGAAGLPPPPV